MEASCDQLLAENPDWLSVLQTYAEHEAAAGQQPAPVEEETADGESGGSRARWVPRLRAVPGVTSDRLAPIHGKLIAHGLLQFTLEGRDAGVHYRLTTLARQTLARVEVASQIPEAPAAQAA